MGCGASTEQKEERRRSSEETERASKYSLAAQVDVASQQQRPHPDISASPGFNEHDFEAPATATTVNNNSVPTMEMPSFVLDPITITSSHDARAPTAYTSGDANSRVTDPRNAVATTAEISTTRRNSLLSDACSVDTNRTGANTIQRLDAKSLKALDESLRDAEVVEW